MTAYEQAVHFCDLAWRQRLIWGFDDARALKDWRACYDLKIELTPRTSHYAVVGG